MYSSRTTQSTMQRQRGAAFMVMLVIMIIGVATMFVASLNSSAIQIARDQTTADALAKAKEALIGYAVSDPTRPGELPCPDVNDDGMLTIGTDLIGSNCASPIGRLPWKTLGLSELRDGAGEHLWYTVSKTFWANGSTPINSNSLGSLFVSGTTAANNVVAIVFAAGPPVGGQSRSPSNTITCATNNSPVAESLCATNYLEGSDSAFSTAITPNPNYQSSNTSSPFNDRLMIISAGDIIPTVELRVAKELTKAFANYLSANGNKYPYPANFANCTSTSITSCPSDATQCIGKIPATQMSFSGTGNTSGSSTTLTFTATTPGMGNLYVGMQLVGTGITAGTYVASIGTYNGTSGTIIMSAAMIVASETITSTQLPSWFIPNNWFDVIYYTAGINSLPGGAGGGGGGAGKKGKGKKGGGIGSGGGGSPGCTPFLTVFDSNGTLIASNANALFLMPDTPTGSYSGTTRTSLSSIPLPYGNLQSYFEDLENQNLDNAYIMPTAISNDSLYILP